MCHIMNCSLYCLSYKRIILLYDEGKNEIETTTVAEHCVSMDMLNTAMSCQA